MCPHGGDGQERWMESEAEYAKQVKAAGPGCSDTTKGGRLNDCILFALRFKL